MVFQSAGVHAWNSWESYNAVFSLLFFHIAFFSRLGWRQGKANFFFFGGGAGHTKGRKGVGGSHVRVGLPFLQGMCDMGPCCWAGEGEVRSAACHDGGWVGVGG